MASLEAQALACFAEVVELSPSRRASYLRRLRTSNVELHDALLRLLAADEESDDRLFSPQQVLAGCEVTPANTSRDERIGQLLGAWRITGLIGAGGMGTVYRASRADGQYQQEVAIKCIGHGCYASQLDDVLRNERNVLAMLEHPNIATLLDGGIDDRGCPWFAMQLLDGEPIDQWCDRRRLSIRERVQLFGRVCDGLAYAHDKAAVHGDIKPGNVLVDGSGRPVLLDFGLSKLTQSGAADASRLVAMTPGFTAPEVASSGSSTASDIYAMGVMLQDLLCGAESRGDVFGLLATAPQTLASVRALGATEQTAKHRGLPNAQALSRQLTGDLDRVLAACCMPDPAQRIASVHALGHELRAWLARRPLALHQQQPFYRRQLYRLRLFLQRNRTLAALAGLVVLSCVVALAVGVRLHGVAARKSAEAASMQRMFANSFVALATGGLGKSPLLPVAQLRDAEHTLRADQAKAAVNAGTAGLMSLALARSYAVFGDYARAMKLADEARQQVAERPDLQSKVQASLAHLHNIQSQHAAALQAADLGLARLDEVPADEREAIWLALQVETARAQWGLVRIEQARNTLRHAVARAESGADAAPKALAELLIQQAVWQELFLRLEPAIASLDRAIALTESVAPIVANAARFEKVRGLNQLSQHQAAVDLATTLLHDQQRILGDVHPETGKVWVELGRSQLWNGQAASALASVEQGLTILRDSLGADHPEAVRAEMIIAGIVAQRGDYAAAIASSRRALAVMEQTYGPNHQRTLTAIGYLAAILAMQASVSPADTAAWDEAVSLFERRVQRGQQQGWPVYAERMMLIKARLRGGEVSAETLQEVRHVLAGMVEARGADSGEVRRARFTLIQVQRALQRLDEAEQSLHALLLDLEKQSPSTNNSIDQFLCYRQLGEIALQRGNKVAAREHWNAAINIGRQVDPDQPSVRRLQTQLARLDEPSVTDSRRSRL